MQLKRWKGACVYGERSVLNRLAWIIFLAVVCLGCPKRLEPSPLSSVVSPSELLDLTSKVESQVSSIRGEARLRVDAPGSQGTATLFVAASRPSLLHLEILGFFGQPQAILVSNGQSFSLFQAEQGKYFHGPASPQNISRLLPVVLPGSELVTIILGGAPRIAAERASAKPLPEVHAYLLTLWRAPLIQKLWIRPEDYRVVKSEVRGAAAYDLLFENFELAGAVVVPRKITLFASEASARLELRYQEVGVNPDLGAALFQLAPPAGANVIELDDNGQPLGR